MQSWGKSGALPGHTWLPRPLFVAMLVILSACLLYADADEFGFKPMSRKLKYVEEFYGLFAQNHMPSTASTEQNIYFLQIALNSPYKHPITQALCVIKTEAEHAQYKRLLRERIAYLIAQGFVQLGYRYDKEDIYFFNLEFADELAKGFDIAEYYYREAIVYWEEAKRMAAEIYRNRSIRLSGGVIDAIQDEARRIHAGDINYRKTIDFRLKDLDRKRQKLPQKPAQ
jgi:hypothetical protein